MREKAIEQKLRETVKKAGGLALKFVSPSFSGVPDRIVMFQGKIWFVEMKSSRGVLSAVQITRHKVFAKRGFKVWVVNSKETLQELLKDMGICF